MSGTYARATLELLEDRLVQWCPGAPGLPGAQIVRFPQFRGFQESCRVLGSKNRLSYGTFGGGLLGCDARQHVSSARFSGASMGNHNRSFGRGGDDDRAVGIFSA